ncbi:MAG: GNAT family N-acetyltransferase [bacterium]
MKSSISKTAALDIINLRHKILRPGRPEATAHFDGDELPTTYHFATKQVPNESEPICCVSYMLSELNGEPAYQLRGMATDDNFRGMGLGKDIVAFAEAMISADTTIKNYWCNARKESVGFYEKLGWKIVSKEFDVPDVGPHFKMVKN